MLGNAYERKHCSHEKCKVKPMEILVVPPKLRGPSVFFGWTVDIFTCLEICLFCHDEETSRELK